MGRKPLSQDGARGTPIDMTRERNGTMPENSVYTVFLIQGDFIDADSLETDFVRLNCVNWDEVKVLIDVALRNELDMVIRQGTCETLEG